MKNRFKNVSIDKVVDVVSSILKENKTKSVNITSKVSLLYGLSLYPCATHDWIFFNENETVEFGEQFENIVMDNLKDLMADGKTSIVIKRQLDIILINCFTVEVLSISEAIIHSTTICCNSYIVDNLIHKLIEKMYFENKYSELNGNSPLIKTIKGLYTNSIQGSESKVELLFIIENNISVKKIDIYLDES